MQKYLWSYFFSKDDPEERLLSLLAQTPIFKGLTRTELKQIERLLYRRKFQHGDYIFKEGDPGVGMYIINEGEVSILLERDGEEQAIGEVAKGQFFGEVSLADASDRTASAKAVGQTELLGFFRPELLSLIEDGKRTDIQIAAKILLKVGEVLGERLRQKNKSRP